MSWTALTLIGMLALKGFLPRPLKPYAPTYPLRLPACLTFLCKLLRILWIGVAQQLHQSQKHPTQQTQGTSSPTASRLMLAKSLKRFLRKGYCLSCSSPLYKRQDIRAYSQSISSNKLFYILKKFLPHGLTNGAQLTLSTWISPKHLTRKTVVSYSPS